MAALTEEQGMLRDAAHGWVREKSPVSAFRKLRDSGSDLGYDAAVWREMVEMGWAGVIIPEQYGGFDFGYVALGLILEATGRTLTASPLVASALAAASALILGGSESQKQEHLPKIANGSLVGTLAIEEGHRHAPQNVALSATRFGDGYTLSGQKTFVLEGMAANLFVVSARVSGKPGDIDGIELFLVPADAKGVSRHRLSLIDSRGSANVALHNVHVKTDAKLSGGHWVLEKALDRARAGVAAEMMGAALQSFETTLDYLRTRVQFGQLIGSFQALQHRAADMFSALELCRSVVDAALTAIDQDSADVPELVSLAKAKVGDSLHLITNEMIQMHGGVGMTDAHDAGLYLKRARACEAVFGNQAYHRDRYARIKGY
jgi:alkylation response protein AidB-like acyl-CoA dehydrogenase